MHGQGDDWIPYEAVRLEKSNRGRHEEVFGHGRLVIDQNRDRRGTDRGVIGAGRTGHGSDPADAREKGMLNDHRQGDQADVGAVTIHIEGQLDTRDIHNHGEVTRERAVVDRVLETDIATDVHILTTAHIVGIVR